MTDVFISYSRHDKEKVAMLARAIEAEGYAVWWDDELPPHQSYGEVITEKIENAKAAVVVWSADASKSEWVRAEADAARNHRKLIQTALSDIIPPLPFNQIQCANLEDWNGEEDHPGWRKVRASLTALCGERESKATAEAAAAAAAAVAAVEAPPPPTPEPEPATEPAPEPVVAAPPPPPPAPPPPPPPPTRTGPADFQTSGAPEQVLGLMGDSASTRSSTPIEPDGEGKKSNSTAWIIGGGIGAIALAGVGAFALTSMGGDDPDFSSSGGSDDFEISSSGGDAVPPPIAPMPDANQGTVPQVDTPVTPNGDGYNRDVTLINQSGETIMFLYWSNVDMDSWGQDQLGTQIMGDGQNWFVTVDDGTGACYFDFMAVTASERQIERRNVNVCSVYEIYFN